MKLLTKKHIKYGILIIIFWSISISLLSSSLSSYERKKRLEELETSVTSLEASKKLLEQEIQYKESSEFIEESARNDLSLIKSGESVFVVVSDRTDGRQVVERELTEKANKTQKIEAPAKQWFRLIF